MNEPPRQLPCSSKAMSSMSAMPTPVGQAAVDLALDDHRVDARAAVVDRDEAADLDLAGARVDVDDADVGAERERQVRRVVDAISASRHGPRRPRAARPRRGRPSRSPGSSALRGVALDEEAALLPLEVVGRRPRASPRRRSAAPSRAPCARRRAVAAPRHRRRAAAVGAEAERRAVGVAVDDLDVLGRDAELLGDDLRERRLVALALALHADAEHAPCRSGGRAARRRRPCRGRGCPCACAGRRRRSR